jgi:hypothetical protein
MKSRFKAFGWHVFGSASALLLVLGTLYLGWYRWPGWYLTGLLDLIPIMVGVDVVLGPLLTFVIASPGKPLRSLARDIGCIVVVQLVALGYGATTLWQGRPVYYAYSQGSLSAIQGVDLQPAEIVAARESSPEFAPHWYTTPHWVWVPLPDDPKLRATIPTGSDPSAMPRLYKAWDAGLPTLRGDLKKVDDLKTFSAKQRKLLKERMQARGFAPDSASTMTMFGKGTPLLAVFDLKTLKMAALLEATP